jgi:hypothetical protein
MPGSWRGRYHTDRQPGAALQNTAICPAGPPARSGGTEPTDAVPRPAVARFLSGHTVSPSDSQEECVTCRSVLAVPWRRVYLWVA